MALNQQYYQQCSAQGLKALIGACANDFAGEIPDLSTKLEQWRQYAEAACPVNTDAYEWGQLVKFCYNIVRHLACEPSANWNADVYNVAKLLSFIDGRWKKGGRTWACHKDQDGVVEDVHAEAVVDLLIEFSNYPEQADLLYELSDTLTFLLQDPTILKSVLETQEWVKIVYNTVLNLHSCNPLSGQPFSRILCQLYMQVVALTKEGLLSPSLWQEHQDLLLSVYKCCQYVSHGGERPPELQTSSNAETATDFTHHMSGSSVPRAYEQNACTHGLLSDQPQKQQQQPQPHQQQFFNQQQSQQQHWSAPYIQWDQQQPLTGSQPLQPHDGQPHDGQRLKMHTLQQHDVQPLKMHTLQRGQQQLPTEERHGYYHDYRYDAHYQEQQQCHARPAASAISAYNCSSIQDTASSHTAMLQQSTLGNHTCANSYPAPYAATQKPMLVPASMYFEDIDCSADNFSGPQLSTTTRSCPTALHGNNTNGVHLHLPGLPYGPSGAAASVSDELSMSSGFPQQQPTPSSLPKSGSSVHAQFSSPQAPAPTASPYNTRIMRAGSMPTTASSAGTLPVGGMLPGALPVGAMLPGAMPAGAKPTGVMPVNVAHSSYSSASTTAASRSRFGLMPLRRKAAAPPPVTTAAGPPPVPPPVLPFGAGLQIVQTTDHTAGIPPHPGLPPQSGLPSQSGHASSSFVSTPCSGPSVPTTILTHSCFVSQSQGLAHHTPSPRSAASPLPLPPPQSAFAVPAVPSQQCAPSSQYEPSPHLGAPIVSRPIQHPELTPRCASTPRAVPISLPGPASLPGPVSLPGPASLPGPVSLPASLPGPVSRPGSPSPPGGMPLLAPFPPTPPVPHPAVITRPPSALRPAAWPQLPDVLPQMEALVRGGIETMHTVSAAPASSASVFACDRQLHSPKDDEADASSSRRPSNVEQYMRGPEQSMDDVSLAEHQLRYRSSRFGSNVSDRQLGTACRPDLHPADVDQLIEQFDSASLSSCRPRAQPTGSSPFYPQPTTSSTFPAPSSSFPATSRPLAQYNNHHSSEGPHSHAHTNTPRYHPQPRPNHAAAPSFTSALPPDMRRPSPILQDTTPSSSCPLHLYHPGTQPYTTSPPASNALSSSLHPPAAHTGAATSVERGRDYICTSVGASHPAHQPTGYNPHQPTGNNAHQPTGNNAHVGAPPFQQEAGSSRQGDALSRRFQIHHAPVIPDNNTTPNNTTQALEAELRADYQPAAPSRADYQTATHRMAHSIGNEMDGGETANIANRGSWGTMQQNTFDAVACNRLGAENVFRPSMGSMWQNTGQSLVDVAGPQAAYGTSLTGVGCITGASEASGSHGPSTNRRGPELVAASRWQSDRKMDDHSGVAEASNSVQSRQAAEGMHEEQMRAMMESMPREKVLAMMQCVLDSYGQSSEQQLPTSKMHVDYRQVHITGGHERAAPSKVFAEQSDCVPPPQLDTKRALHAASTSAVTCAGSPDLISRRFAGLQVQGNGVH